jgi:HK97 family phage major capsid protein
MTDILPSAGDAAAEPVAVPVSAALPAPERKASAVPVRGGDLAGAFDEFMTAFEAFRDSNDRRLAELERRGSADPLTVAALERLETALDTQKDRMDALALKAARPALAGDGGRPGRVELEQRSAFSTAFSAYVRQGDAAGLARLEEKALSVAVNADGGYLVPPELDREVSRRLAAISPIRALATVRQVSGTVFQKPFSASGPGAGWSSETGALSATATPTLSQLSFPTGELYAMPAASHILLDDAAVDVEAWIADEVETVFAEQEGAAFVAGDGSGKPKGFLAYPTVAQASWSSGSIGYVATGVSAGLPTVNPSDKLVDLVYALKAGYRQNAHWVMGRKTQAELRKLKDTTGAYLWQPPAVAGGQASLMNFPLVEAEDMPAIAADSLPIAFGDFRRGYLVVDRVGMRVLRDPYSAKPNVLFYTTRRVGGGVQDFDAIKLMKFGAG